MKLYLKVRRSSGDRSFRRINTIQLPDRLNAPCIIRADEKCRNVSAIVCTFLAFPSSLNFQNTRNFDTREKELRIKDCLGLKTHEPLKSLIFYNRYNKKRETSFAPLIRYRSLRIQRAIYLRDHIASPYSVSRKKNVLFLFQVLPLRKINQSCKKKKKTSCSRVRVCDKKKKISQ